MTRAIGHMHLERFGVISQPDITFLDLEKHHCCLLLATDGVWDAFDPRRAIEITIQGLLDGNTATVSTASLCTAAVDHSIDNGGSADNTSAVLLYFGGGIQQQ